MRFSDPDTQARARARRVFRDQPRCKACGEKGYLRFDDDCDLYVICDVCGQEYDADPTERREQIEQQQARETA